MWLLGVAGETGGAVGTGLGADGAGLGGGTASPVERLGAGSIERSDFVPVRGRFEDGSSSSSSSRDRFVALASARDASGASWDKLTRFTPR